MQYICRWTLPHRYPGSLNHLQTDARTFADWGVITNYYRCRWHLHCFGAALWIHIVTHCGCERGGHCAVKYGEDFLQKSNKRIVDLLYHLFPVLCWATWYLHQVDYVKLDGCHSDPATMEVSRDQPYKNILWWNMVGEIWSWSWFLVIDRQAGYAEFGAALRATGRPIVYQCEWPLYQVRQQVKVSNIPEQ